MLVLKLELLSINEELVERTLEFGEAAPLVLSSVVVFCKLALDIKLLLALSVVVRVCDVTEEVTKLELSTGELRVRLTVTLDGIAVLLLVNTAVVGCDVTFRVLVLSEKTLEKLTMADADTKLLVFKTLLFTSVTKLEMEMLVPEASTLLVFGNKLVEEAKLGLLVDGTVVTNKEVFEKSLLEVASADVEFTGTTSVETCVVMGGKLVLGEETDEFTSGVTTLDNVEEFPCDLETAVESTATLELLERLGGMVTKDEFDVTIALVKSGLNVERVSTLGTRKVLNNDKFVLKMGVAVMLTLELSTPIEVAVMEVRLVAKVLGNVWLPLVPVSVFDDVVNVANDDLSIFDVEFTSAVLLAVEGKCETES